MQIIHITYEGNIQHRTNLCDENRRNHREAYKQSAKTHTQIIHNRHTKTTQHRTNLYDENRRTTEII